MNKIIHARRSTVKMVEEMAKENQEFEVSKTSVSSPPQKNLPKGVGGGANKEKRSTGSDPQDEGLSACFSATNKVHY